MKRWVVLAWAALAGTATANVRAYDIAPYKCYEGWTATGGYVAQQFVACADSLVYVDFFAGQKPAHSVDGYLVQVVDGGTVLYEGNATDQKEWAYARADLARVNQSVPFVCGKTYLLKVSHTGSPPQPINYFYDPRNTYTWGGMSVGGGEGQPPPQSNDDLVARIYGYMDLVDSTYWGACEWSWWACLRPGGLNFSPDTFRSRMSESRVRSVRFDLDWNLVQHGGRDCWNWDLLDQTMRGIRADSGCRPLALLLQTPTWASTRIDSHYVANEDTSYMDYDTSLFCAPRHLFDAVGSDSNFLVRFIDSVVHHYDNLGMPVHDWEVWNEPNDTHPDPAPGSGITGWWRRPTRFYRADSFPGLRGLCSLYMRMAYVVNAVVKDSSCHPGHQHDRIAIGSMHKVLAGDDGGTLVSGRRWLRTCYQVAQARDGPGIFWDAVSVHPYQDIWALQPETLRVHAETLRAIMRTHGDHGGLWSTEYGWNAVPQGYGQEQDARNVCAAFVSHLASAANPAGGYDRLYWWYFHRFNENWCWGLVESTMTRQMAFHAFKQACSTLTGRRLNGRVVLGDARDDSVRVYEFEGADHRRTWVAWQTLPHGQGTEIPTVVEIPARTDTLDTVALAYDANPPGGAKAAAVDGWLELPLTSRPVFVTEASSVCRPDLVVDSVIARPVSQPNRLYAFIRNTGNDSTGTGNPVFGHPGTVVRFYQNDSLLGQIDHTPNIPAGGSVVVGPLPWQPPSAGNLLVKATVNETRAYVELGTDDNAAYRRY